MSGARSEVSQTWHMLHRSSIRMNHRRRCMMRPPSPSFPSVTVRRVPCFCVLNLLIALSLLAACLLAIVMRESAGSSVGGIVFCLPLAIYSFCEWLAFYRRQVSIERQLGYAKLVCAAFMTFAVVANLVEVFLNDATPSVDFLLRFATLGGIIVSYLVTSGWCRLYWTRERVNDGTQNPYQSPHRE